MIRYLFIAALAFAGDYACGAADGFTYAMRVLPLSAQLYAH